MNHKGEVRLSIVIIGMILIGMLVTGLTIFMSEAVSEYEISGYNESEYESYNQITELTGKLEEFENSSGTVNQDNNQDILGALFSNAYTGAQTVKESGDVANSLVSDGINQLPIAQGYKSTLITGIQGIILTVFVVGIFFAFITKSTRT